MARIRIKDIAKDVKIGKNEMRRVLGGISSEPVYCQPNLLGLSSDRLYRVGMRGIAPLPTPYPRPMSGWIGIEPNPTP